MTKSAAQRVIWRGWTLVNSLGKCVTDADFQEPFLWIKKRDAQECCELDIGDQVVRCEIRLRKEAK